MAPSSIFFDRQDHALLHMVNHILERGQRGRGQRQLFAPELHPHGIKELAVSRELSVAYAVINLLDSLEVGGADDRILALRSLHEEVLYAASSSFRRNTGRVLIQIMKDLVRTHGDPERQIRLARDFREAATGKRRIVRAMLRRYHLLEMPEEWDQLTFDNHVHDANTKGRKTPTHLIMDAWIKGIRALTVIYYNFVEPRAAHELMQAAEIMGIRTRIGVEYRACFRGKYVEFIWEPAGIEDARSMAAFLEEDAMRMLMRDGRDASAYQARHVFAMLERYNGEHRRDMADQFGIEMPEISRQEFLAFVGAGQPSLLHLAELVYNRMLPRMLDRLPALREAHAAAPAEGKKAVEELIARMHALHPEAIMETWFTVERNPSLPDPELPAPDPQTPPVLRLSPHDLTERLRAVRPMSRLTLTLSGLTIEDVLELLYDCQGRITHLELFNLKDYAAGKMPHCKAINQLQRAVSQGSAIELKRLIRGIIRDYDGTLRADAAERHAHMTDILRNIQKLQSFYKNTPLKTRIGSDSTSRSFRLHGMGFAFTETLPASARRSIRDPKDFLRQVIPLHSDIDSRYTYSPATHHHPTPDSALTRMIRKLPLCRYFGYARTHAWVAQTSTTRYTETDGSIATLGGFQREAPERITLREQKTAHASPGLNYLNTGMANALKVLVGFALTMGTFLLTQDWWVLIWFGAPIWFAITGLRNILQSVLGGGGFHRTPLLKWNDYVSWSRICDSLLYTGISVPLLELILRWWILGEIFDVTALTHPLLFYTVISAANGVYIAAHNIYRGLPREAVIGNIFRSVLCIPLSLVYSVVIMHILLLLHVEGGMDMLDASAAIISKAASDTIAGIVEGIGDQNANLRMRGWDYTEKLRQLFACFARLEVLLPEDDVLDLLQRPRDKSHPAHPGGPEAEKLEKDIVIHCLDLMYFWMYQPRGRTMLSRILRAMTREEKVIFARTQLVLGREKEICRLFVDDIVGQNFSRPLAFFLDRYREYLADTGRVAGVALEVPDYPV